ncbi:hypothetical protein [Sedimenticola selenatireducens]|uniref:Uncharacterized protein n=1 Tax=Sedimenticola selenatireducens TaxID=191960 RepID=A0A557SM06_9GAMM|nr:hypothetical protein [Sedimenticola selenatireducens]TVO78447.1 hypothetical protein FHP88_01920 [Sedimenticola selenatireducens]TVT62694.1 MAG: hypothetical protein FHK78_13535 [Sedimenticola selenatireducens]
MKNGAIKDQSVLDEIEKIYGDYTEGKYEGFTPLCIAAHLLTINVYQDEALSDTRESGLALVRAINLLIEEVLSGRIIAYDPISRLPINKVVGSNSHEEEFCVDIGVLIEDEVFTEWVAGNMPASFWMNESAVYEEERRSFYINEPGRKDDWYDCIKDHTLCFYNKYNKLPLKGQLWSFIFNSGMPDWSLVIDKKKVQIELGGKSLDRETFKKRFKEYFPEDNGE